MYKTVLILAACSAAALAQTPVNPKIAGVPPPGLQISDTAEFGTVGVTAAVAGPAATITGAPYSAQVSTQRVQLLADGNRIEQTTSGTVARDSQGRVRRDETLPGLSSSAGDAPHLLMIEDPVAGVHWTLDAETKTATKMPFPHIKKGTPAGFVPPPLGGDDVVFVSAAPPPPPGPEIRIVKKTQVTPDSAPVKTDLGVQNIEGIAAKGTRITRTIPAGAIGNDLPIVITTETWYSPELKVLVMSKTNDPRMGETTYRLTDIQRSEPSPSLFQVPDGYTIKDRPANTFFYRTREFKKNP